MIKSEVVPYVLTFNEAPNIRRCLEHLTWAERVVVVDSFSSDDTYGICSEFSNVEWVQNAFESHSLQHSFALKCVGDASWVLRLDADWTVPEEFVEWLSTVEPAEDVSAFLVPFDFSIHGDAVPIAHYPSVPCLYRKNSVCYVQDGHTERLSLKVGEFAAAPYALIHDDRKDITRWIANQSKYSALEANKLMAASSLNGYGRVRKLFANFPIIGIISVVSFYLLLKLGLFRGLSSKHYVIQRIVAELCIMLQQIDQKVARRGSK